jgi:predicted RNase H-like HicB family nuclease
MAVQFVLTGYVDEALDQAVYDKLDDGTFAGRIPACPGAIAFGDTLRRCEAELRSTLADWLVVGLRSGHQLPVLGGIYPNNSADAIS